MRGARLRRGRGNGRRVIATNGHRFDQGQTQPSPAQAGSVAGTGKHGRGGKALQGSMADDEIDAPPALIDDTQGSSGAQDKGGKWNQCNSAAGSALYISPSPFSYPFLPTLFPFALPGYRRRRHQTS
jgi:hypothetical protein